MTEVCEHGPVEPAPSRAQAATAAVGEVREVRPRPLWFLPFLIAAGVMIVCALAGHRLGGLLVEPVTRWQIERADDAATRPPRPDLPSTPFSRP